MLRAINTILWLLAVAGLGGCFSVSDSIPGAELSPYENGAINAESGGVNCDDCPDQSALTEALFHDSDDDGLSNLDELLLGNNPFDPTDGTRPTIDEQQFFTSCEFVQEPELTTGSFDCTGPDRDGWSNTAAPEDAGLCPPPPNGNCTQAVIGRLADTKRYINCPGYIVLNRTDWTIDMNDNFIACATACDLGTCDPAVIVVSDRSDVPNSSMDLSATSVTSRELCQFRDSECTVVFANEKGPGFVDCVCPRP